jgi:hypothetical protein
MPFYNRKHLRIFLQYSAFALVLFGIKLWVIQNFGNATPYWDQWDAEAANLYEPFLSGTLSWADLFAPHNVHRIFTTRILALILLIINGIWNPLLQMIVNAGLHIVTLVLLIILLLRVIGEKYTSFMLFFSIFLFSIPYDWENTLAGFNAQIYFVILFSIIGLWYTSTNEIFSTHWWLGIGGALLAYFSFASGVFVFASQAFVGGIFYLFGLRKTKKQILAIALTTVGFLLGVAMTPTSSADTSKTVVFFIRGLAKVFSWPLGTTLVTVFDWHLVTYFFAALLCNFPAILFTVLMLWKRPHMNDRRWFLMSLVIWAVGQNLSIAFGRGAIASRYLTFFAVFLLINSICFITFPGFFAEKSRRWIKKLAGTWLLLMAISLGYYSWAYIPGEIIDKKETGILHENNTRNYLLTGDFKYLEDKPFEASSQKIRVTYEVFPRRLPGSSIFQKFQISIPRRNGEIPYLQIPYPSAERLGLILESDAIRSILPSNIRAPISYEAAKSIPDNHFSFGHCCDPLTPKPDYETFGSYGEEDVITTGTIGIEFDFSNNRSPWVKIPLAGYPLASGIKVEIEQGGERTIIPIESNPKATWREIYLKTSKEKFSVYLTDASSENWAAFGMPVEVGRLDRFVDILLVNDNKFLITGFIFYILSILPYDS